jgi:hypothetical protein
MVNIPHRSSESLMAEAVTLRLAEMRRTAGAVVLAFVVAWLLAALLGSLPEGTRLLHDLVPLDDPAMAAIFTA